MNFCTLLAPAFLAMLVTACAQGGGSQGSRSQGTGDEVAISCDGFVDAGSALDLAIKSTGSAPECEREYQSHGRINEIFGTVGIVGKNADEMTSGILVLVYRYYGLNASLDRPIDMASPKRVNFRHLPQQVPVQLTGSKGPVFVTRYESRKSSMTSACLRANTVNQNGSRSVVEICRSVGKMADDSQVLAMVEKIGAEDFPAINP